MHDPDDLRSVDRSQEEPATIAELHEGLAGVGEYVRSQIEPLEGALKALEQDVLSGQRGVNSDIVKILRDMHREYAWRGQYNMALFRGLIDALDILTADAPVKRIAVYRALNSRLDQLKREHPRPVLESARESGG